MKQSTQGRLFKKVSKYDVSGLKSNIQNLYEDVEEYHSPRCRESPYVYNPHNILQSTSSISSEFSPPVEDIKLEGPASMKKALKIEFETSPQPGEQAGNFTEREQRPAIKLPLTRLNQNVSCFKIKL